MNIELNTVYDSVGYEKFGQLCVKYCMEDEIKRLNRIIWFIGGAAVLEILFSVIGAVNEPFFPITLVFLAALIIVTVSKKRLLPKNITVSSAIGCPYGVTMGFYNEYFYVKTENCMSIQEVSVRYEFLKIAVETAEYFILMTQRGQAYFVPKKDMSFEDSLELSAFLSRFSHIYKAV